MRRQVLNLLKLSDEQQGKVINSQMKGNVFFDHLISLSVIRKGQDEIFESSFPQDTKARQRIERLAAPKERPRRVRVAGARLEGGGALEGIRRGMLL